MANRQFALEACDAQKVPFYGDLPIKANVRVHYHLNTSPPDLSHVSWWFTKIFEDRLWAGKPHLRAFYADVLRTAHDDRVGIRVFIERKDE